MLMTFACIQNCNMCPFQCRPRKTVNNTVVKEKVDIKPETVEEPKVEAVTENGLAVVENVPVFEVRKNIFGKEKVVRKV